MMKWKVVKNPRSASADRSLECLRNDVQPQAKPVVKNDNNNNNSLGEDNNNSNNQQGNCNSLPLKETNKQRDTSLTRKSSGVTTDCLNLKSFLGLSRQRSETNLSNLGLKSDQRRSRSEVRGLSCDRLAVGYNTNPQKTFQNGQTRSSSPPSKSGCWIRGRKRERESRNPVKNNLDVFGKTIVTDSNGKSSRTSSKTKYGDCRTIADSCDSKHKSKVSSKGSLESRKNRSSKRNAEDDIIIEEEVIYTEIDQDDVKGKLMDENKEIFKDPKKVVRKKGMAPKPQIAAALFKEISGMEVNLNPNGRPRCGTPNSCSELCQLPPDQKIQRRNQTYNGRNQDKKADNRLMNSVKLNNLKNNEKAMWNQANNINSQVVAVAEVHKQLTPSNSISGYVNSLERLKKSVKKGDGGNKTNNKDSTEAIVHHTNMDVEDLPPYHIDTPDYSTLDSVHCCGLLSQEDIPLLDNNMQIIQDEKPESQDQSHFSQDEIHSSQDEIHSFQDDTQLSHDDTQLSQDEIHYSQDDLLNCNTDCDENMQESSISKITSSNSKRAREISLSGILRDSSNEIRNSDSEPKKTVRFEKLDLIEKYKKHKSETRMDTENDTDLPICCDSRQLLIKNMSDINRNDEPGLKSDSHTLLESDSESPDTTMSDLLPDANCISYESETNFDVDVNFGENDTNDSKFTDTICVHTNTNELPTTVVNFPNTHSNSGDELVSEPSCQRGMTVNVYVRNPSPAPMSNMETSLPKQCVVKKSFVLTVAKQENGFRSLYANKKPEIQPEEPKSDQQISVTFLCSGPPSESWIQSDQEESFRLRSISVPPRSLQQPITEVPSVVSALRCRSRDRRPKERTHCKKNKSKKKEATVFVMPQAVIDELSQVLEKRKPSSLDGVRATTTVHP